MAIADDGAQKALIDFVDDIRLIPLDELMHLEELDVAQLSERCDDLRAEVVVLLSFYGGNDNTVVNTMRHIHCQRGGRGKFITGVFRRREAGLPKKSRCPYLWTRPRHDDVLRCTERGRNGDRRMARSQSHPGSTLVFRVMSSGDLHKAQDDA
jgi:hypothetical protein